jgi:hypothetical protein
MDYFILIYVHLSCTFALMVREILILKGENRVSENESMTGSKNRIQNQTPVVLYSKRNEKLFFAWQDCAFMYSYLMYVCLFVCLSLCVWNFLAFTITSAKMNLFEIFLFKIFVSGGIPGLLIFVSIAPMFLKIYAILWNFFC